jgi:chromosomal replication initiation ATPase DnaA
VEEHGGPVKKERRRREYSLAQIAGAVVQAGEMGLDDLRGSGRQRELSQGRVAFTVLAKEYGYRGTEIAEYLKKDPTAVTQYARKRDEAREFIAAAEKVLAVNEKLLQNQV